MAGLNHESTTRSRPGLAIHLEVTSNRPDCLGHIGMAREAAVLWDRELKTARRGAASRRAGGRPSWPRVRIECPDLCPRYTARVIRGVKIGPSPAWLRARLATIGIAAINNVVDITNYVLMECGQPLHAFDLAQAGRRADRGAAARERRNPRRQSTTRATRSKPEMCVIADAQRPVGLAGVMGGAETEVTAATRDLLIESAAFAPMSIRATARRLEFAQRFVVSVRARARSAGDRLGQPPLLRVDFGTGRRGTGRRRDRRRHAAGASGSR